jgi:hypothetical protein
LRIVDPVEYRRSTSLAKSGSRMPGRGERLNLSKLYKLEKVSPKVREIGKSKLGSPRAQCEGQEDHDHLQGHCSRAGPLHVVYGAARASLSRVLFRHAYGADQKIRPAESRTVSGDR